MFDLIVRNAALPDGLGRLPGSHCPHYDSESQRRPTYGRLVAEGTLAAGYAADDGVALRFDGTSLVEVVSQRPAGRAWHVRPEPTANEGVRHEALTVRRLRRDGTLVEGD